MRETFRAVPCPCGYPSCKSWFVDPVASVQCVSFTEAEARAVAEFMNGVDWEAKQRSVVVLGALQARVHAWVETTLPGQAYDLKTRAARFLEEAAEAAQAAGLHELDALVVLAQVYARPPGDLAQELGGSTTTLCALASAAGVDLGAAALREVERMETPEVRAKVQRRQAEKVSPR